MNTLIFVFTLIVLLHPSECIHQRVTHVTRAQGYGDFFKKLVYGESMDAHNADVEKGVNWYKCVKSIREMKNEEKQLVLGYIIQKITSNFHSSGTSSFISETKLVKTGLRLMNMINQEFIKDERYDGFVKHLVSKLTSSTPHKIDFTAELMGYENKKIPVKCSELAIPFKYEIELLDKHDRKNKIATKNLIKVVDLSNRIFNTIGKLVKSGNELMGPINAAIPKLQWNIMMAINDLGAAKLKSDFTKNDGIKAWNRSLRRIILTTFVNHISGKIDCDAMEAWKYISYLSAPILLESYMSIYSKQFEQCGIDNYDDPEDYSPLLKELDFSTDNLKIMSNVNDMFIEDSWKMTNDLVDKLGASGLELIKDIKDGKDQIMKALGVPTSISEHRKNIIEQNSYEDAMAKIATRK